jgi:hypothetical protein
MYQEKPHDHMIHPRSSKYIRCKRKKLKSNIGKMKEDSRKQIEVFVITGFLNNVDNWYKL